MPTTKKRINLTLPEEVYNDILAFKQKAGLASDATACLMLIQRQLKAEKETAAIIEFAKRIPLDDLQKLSSLGLAQLKAEADKAQ